jgi:hypothetical protein
MLQKERVKKATEEINNLSNKYDENDQHDVINRQLSEKIIDAEYDYIKHLYPVWINKFREETKDLVVNDYDSTYFNKRERNSSMTEICESMMEIVFPLISKEEWASETYSLICEIYENNYEEDIKALSNYYEEKKTLEGFVDFFNNKVSKKEQIDRWKRQLWYLWNTHEGYRSLFITPTEYEEEKALEEEKVKIGKEYNEFMEKDNITPKCKNTEDLLEKCTSMMMIEDDSENTSTKITFEQTSNDNDNLEEITTKTSDNNECNQQCDQQCDSFNE